MKKIHILLLTLIYCSIGLGQDLVTGSSGRAKTNSLGEPMLFIHSWEKPTKIKTYKEGVFFEIKYNQLYTDTSSIMQFYSLNQKHKIKDSSLTISLSGSLRNVTDSSLTIAVKYESVKIDYKNGLYTNINNTYFQDPYNIQTGIDYGDELRTVNFKQINNIGSTDVKKGYAFGSSLTVVSIFTTLIIAPLASINYRTGKFNQHNFYSIAGGGLAGMTIGIPIIFLTRDEKFYTTRFQKVGDYDENYYYLDNK